ncbi:type II toxin-antitoxin system VapC family toxin [Trichlorobacter lovleyi]|uniref:Ribonuclease VapC n=1 Tax=Trichlorobacter lovleyi (strain ATCC BAA-1151 / DSM 17278 / SZ) TaxID=398767 RepID=B3E9D9_TRIL1|nr:PIN domain-containing protein [Trichlorobacter lovleyi]ACD93805.1 PilT protein domain protein [Trichlorobacter lovleyi SZ]
MKPYLFVDTDVVLDLLARREPFYDAAARLFSEAEAGNLTLCVSSLTFANLFYLLRKQHSGPQAQQVLRTFKQLVSVVAVDDTIVEQALHAGFTDFEDALQYFCALSARCSGLITRNVRHYRKSSIRVVTAEGYFAAAG